MRLVGVHLRYGRRPEVLSGVDLALPAGEAVLILGSNGSGKSSLLRIVAGCLRPTTGVAIDRPRSVAYVPDRFPGQLRMPAISYLRHMAALHRAGPRTALQRATRLLDELGFADQLATPMARLSKGNAQKIALTQALCSQTPVLALDEPWSGLAPEVRPVLTEQLAELTANGAAIVITDHTGAAQDIPGCAIRSLREGRLVAVTDSSASKGTQQMVRLVLLHEQPVSLASRLRRWHPVRITGHLVTVHVPADHSDSLLAAVLRWGASVHRLERYREDPAPDFDRPGEVNLEADSQPGGDQR